MIFLLVLIFFAILFPRFMRTIIGLSITIFLFAYAHVLDTEHKAKLSNEAQATFEQHTIDYGASIQKAPDCFPSDWPGLGHRKPCPAWTTDDE